MSRKNIMTVLERLMKEHNIHAEWQITWLDESHAVRMNLQCPLKNNEQYLLKNKEGQQNDSAEIIYETRVLFYDANRYHLSSDDLLQVIPVDAVQGIKYGELVACVKYLKQIVQKLPLHFDEFLHRDDVKVFQAKWIDSDYQLIRQRIIDQRRYSDERVFLPDSREADQ
ncbi:DUF3013 family protein [Aerococcaceae bacterium DSM 111020]|nr:DUF3013 family protein [Aerococcaceae bacterium DSM 111020]